MGQTEGSHGSNTYIRWLRNNNPDSNLTIVTVFHDMIVTVFHDMIVTVFHDMIVTVFHDNL